MVYPIYICRVCHRKWWIVLLIIIMIVDPCVFLLIFYHGDFDFIIQSCNLVPHHYPLAYPDVILHDRTQNHYYTVRYDYYGGVRGLTTISRIKRNAVYSVIITLYCTSAGYYYIYSAISARVFNQIDTKLTTISWVRANITFINMLFVSL